MSIPRGNSQQSPLPNKLPNTRSQHLAFLSLRKFRAGVYNKAVDWWDKTAPNLVFEASVCRKKREGDVRSVELGLRTERLRNLHKCCLTLCHPLGQIFRMRSAMELVNSTEFSINLGE